MSQRIRKRIEDGFGWGKMVGPIGRIRMRDRVDTAFIVSDAAWNLLRPPRLLDEPKVA